MLDAVQCSASAFVSGVTSAQWYLNCQLQLAECAGIGHGRACTRARPGRLFKESPADDFSRIRGICPGDSAACRFEDLVCRLSHSRTMYSSIGRSALLNQAKALRRGLRTAQHNMLPIICRSSSSTLHAAARSVLLPASLSRWFCDPTEQWAHLTGTMLLPGVNQCWPQLPQSLRFLSSKPSSSAAEAEPRRERKLLFNIGRCRELIGSGDGTSAPGVAAAAAAALKAEAAAAATAILTLHKVRLDGMESIFTEHRACLDAAGVEKVVLRVLQLATAALHNSSANSNSVPASFLSQPAAILSRILSHHPPLSVRAATELVVFFAWQPTMPVPRIHLLSTLCGVPDDQIHQFDIRRTGDTLCAISIILPSIVPGSAMGTEISTRRGKPPASDQTPAIDPNLHKACIKLSQRLVQHASGLLSHSDISPSPKPFLGPEALSVICVGAARLQVRNTQFWDAVASSLLRGSLKGASVHMCSNVAWAFTVAGTDSKHLANVFQHIADLVVRKNVRSLVSTTSRGQLLAAFGKVGFHHTQLFDMVLSSFVADCSKLDMLNLTSVLLACARVGHDRQLVDELLQKLAVSASWERRLLTETPHRLAANMLWSLSVMEMVLEHDRLVSQLLLIFQKTAPHTQLRPLEAMQLTQVYASLLRYGISISGLPPKAQLACMVAVGVTENADFNQLRGSKAQSEVFQRLARMKGSNGIVAVEEEAPLIGGLVNVDVLVTFESGRQVAVEMDGPSHFLLSDKSKVGGSTRWRNDTVSDALGGRHNLVCIKRDGPQWLNYISGRSVERGADKFLLRELLFGSEPQSS